MKIKPHLLFRATLTIKFYIVRVTHFTFIKNGAKEGVIKVSIAPTGLWFQQYLQACFIILLKIIRKNTFCYTLISIFNNTCDK